MAILWLGHLVRIAVTIAIGLLLLPMVVIGGGLSPSGQITVVLTSLVMPMTMPVLVSPLVMGREFLNQGSPYDPLAIGSLSLALYQDRDHC